MDGEENVITLILYQPEATSAARREGQDSYDKKKSTHPHASNSKRATM